MLPEVTEIFPVNVLAPVIFTTPLTVRVLELHSNLFPEGLPALKLPAPSIQIPVPDPRAVAPPKAK